jgi:hypothetical protein
LASWCIDETTRDTYLNYPAANLDRCRVGRRRGVLRCRLETRPFALNPTSHPSYLAMILRRGMTTRNCSLHLLRRHESIWKQHRLDPTDRQDMRAGQCWTLRLNRPRLAAGWIESAVDSHTIRIARTPMGRRRRRHLHTSMLHADPELLGKY